MWFILYNWTKMAFPAGCGMVVVSLYRKLVWRKIVNRWPIYHLACAERKTSPLWTTHTPLPLPRTVPPGGPRLPPADKSHFSHCAGRTWCSNRCIKRASSSSIDYCAERRRSVDCWHAGGRIAQVQLGELRSIISRVKLVTQSRAMRTMRAVKSLKQARRLKSNTHRRRDSTRHVGVV